MTSEINQDHREGWPQRFKATHLLPFKATVQPQELVAQPGHYTHTPSPTTPSSSSVTSGTEPSHMDEQGLSLVIPPTLMDFPLCQQQEAGDTERTSLSIAPGHRHFPGLAEESGPDQNPLYPRCPPPSPCLTQASSFHFLAGHLPSPHTSLPLTASSLPLILSPPTTRPRKLTKNNTNLTVSLLFPTPIMTYRITSRLSKWPDVLRPQPARSDPHTTLLQACPHIPCCFMFTYSVPSTWNEFSPSQLVHSSSLKIQLRCHLLSEAHPYTAPASCPPRSLLLCSHSAEPRGWVLRQCWLCWWVLPPGRVVLNKPLNPSECLFMSKRG